MLCSELEGVVTLDAISGASILPGQKEKSPNAKCVQTQSGGKSTARGYNATCFVGIVHFLRFSTDDYGTMGTEGTKESMPLTCLFFV